MNLTEKPEVRDLLSAARATRTYCMLTGRGADKSDRLIDALSPFDGAPSQIKPHHLVELRKAMRDTCRDIDDYTLTRILDGDPPVRISAPASRTRRTNGSDEEDIDWSARLSNMYFRIKRGWPWLWQRWILPGIAVLLFIFAMHYTHWTFSANQLLARLNDHISTDIHDEVRDLIVVARAIETNGEQTSNPGSNAPAQKLFNETMSRLKAYHFQEYDLHTKTAAALKRFDIVVATREAIRGIGPKIFQDTQSNVEKAVQNLKLGSESSGGMETEEVETNLGSNTQSPKDVVKTADQAEEKVEQLRNRSVVLNVNQRAGPPDENLPDLSEAEQMLAMIQIALAQRAGFLEIVKQISTQTDRHPERVAHDHIVSSLELLGSAEKLKSRISQANRFALPIIYGALGAALFCLVRVLTPALSELGPAREFLRILFGAFAAMTLSMLFIPANVFSINEQSNPTLIFLACFLFGYSFDAVLAALHRLEAFLQGRLQTQDNGKGV